MELRQQVNDCVAVYLKTHAVNPGVREGRSMISMLEILRLASLGKMLPQEKFGEITDATIDAVWAEEPRLVDLAIRSLLENRSPEIISNELNNLCDRHGWYPVGAILVRGLSWRYRDKAVEATSFAELDDDSRILAKLCAELWQVDRDGEDPGGWTIPLAVFASLGEEKGRSFLCESLLLAAFAEIEWTP